MNTQFKVGQRVKVITGANVTPSEQFNGMEGVITEIQRNNTPDVMIYVDFENGYKIWCYTQKDKGIELNVEILEDTPPTPKWLPIDKDNLPSDTVAAMNITQPTHIFTGTLELNRYDDITLYIGNGQYLSNFTHYISLSDLLNLPIAE